MIGGLAGNAINLINFLIFQLNYNTIEENKEIRKRRDMEKIICNLIYTIKSLVNSEAFKEKFRVSNTDFVRNRKISVSTIVFFILSSIKSGLVFDLEHFLQYSKTEKFSTAAMTKSRKKLSYLAMEEILSVSVEEIPVEKTWKNYQLLALDGMVGELPKTKELMKKYHNTKTAAYPQFHAIALYDVLNHHFISSTFDPAPTNERKAALSLLQKQKSNLPCIYLFDRGFPSLEMIYFLLKEKKSFVFRVSKSFLKEVNSFFTSSQMEEIVSVCYTKKRAKDAKIKNITEFPMLFELRCVKITLDTGETEVLITNLSKEEASLEELGELYFLRWNIEVSYNHLKNAILIEEFTGILENSIKQEFYASLFIYNLTNLFVKQAEETKEEKKKKYQYKINRTKAISILRYQFVKLFYLTRKFVLNTIKKLKKRLLEHKTVIKPERKFSRERSTCKHPVCYRRVRFAVC